MRHALALAVVAIALPALAEPSNEAPSRRKELRRIEKELHRKELRARDDIRTSRPVAERLTELADGSYYRHADPSIAYEALAPVELTRASLRDGGRILLVTLAPPTNLLPAALAQPTSPDVGVPVIVELDVDAAGGVRDALASLVYLPGETPDEAAGGACLARYPEHDEKRSRMRCGVAD